MRLLPSVALILVLAACQAESINLGSQDTAPTHLTYTMNPATYAVGLVIPDNVPSNGGGAATSYAITPELPAGLSFETTTGIISGTPTALSSTTDYTVTATNAGGSTSVVLVITVNPKGPIDAIAAGGAHTCVLVNGGVQCWGRNLDGQLGNNTTTDSLVPVAVTGLTSGVQSIALGFTHTCAVVNGGALCWGENTDGQLGNNSNVRSSVPVAVTGLTSGVQAIAAGFTHTCALVNGGVQCWGANLNGELGNNIWMDSLVPRPVASLTSGVQAIEAGINDTCALVNGAVQCWGRNEAGELGNDSTESTFVPVVVTGLTGGVQAMAVGGFHVCALVSGGVQCWGNNNEGQLGNTSILLERHVPVAVTGLPGSVQAIVTGMDHTCALVNGNVVCWGWNLYGQLGNNSTTDSHVPVPVLLSF